MSTGLPRTIYGPVASWRLGRSLGVDLVSRAQKTCSFDCSYCQLGPTQVRTIERREFVPTSRLVAELEALPSLALDFVTFSGCGEPTLALNLREAVRVVKARLGAPVAVLTNSSLFSDPEVRRALAAVDLVVAKLDAWDAEGLSVINRPAPGITWAGVWEGLRALRAERDHGLALQMMFCEANQHHAAALAALARELAVDEVQVNTPLRPSPVRPLSREEMRLVMGSFAGLPALCVYDASRPQVEPLERAETLARRPVL